MSINKLTNNHTHTKIKLMLIFLLQCVICSSSNILECQTLIQCKGLMVIDTCEDEYDTSALVFLDVLERDN